jgi:23S rRNA pseudouridine1911/1915/1917 synthase
VVHPGAGNPAGTLLNGLLHRFPELAAIPRAGIVHRLDKDTSGLMVVARTLESQTDLVRQLQARSVGRHYLAVVRGTLTGGGKVDAPIGRHPSQRTKMAVVAADKGKPAVTHYTVARRFGAHSLLELKLETGRTHQIRVHMASIKHPLVGDPVYGGRQQLPRGCHPELARQLQAFPRQALHAARLGLIHPASGKPMSWEAATPADMGALIATITEFDPAP